MALTLILSVGLDPELLDTRNLVLQSAGYTVVPAYSINEAVDCFLAGNFDFVLLCESIPAPDRDRLTTWVRAFGSHIPVVSVAGKFQPSDGSGGVTVDSDPDALLKGIAEVLIGVMDPAARTGTLGVQLEAAAAQRQKLPRSIAEYNRQTRIA